MLPTLSCKRQLDATSAADAKAAKKARKLEKAAKLERKLADAAGVAASSKKANAAKEAGVLSAAIQRVSADRDAARAFCASHEITLDGAGTAAPAVVTSLADAPFPQPLVELLLSQPGFTAPSAVQGAAWPAAVAGRDVLAVAKTGSGKTLGYLLPALARWHAVRGKLLSSGPRHPYCLVMAPTRELAIQINEQALLFGAPLGARSVVVYGGAPKVVQAGHLSRGADIVVATPGRMLDMLAMQARGGGKGKGKGKGKGGRGGRGGGRR